MSNVYKLDGSTNVKMGTFRGQPALFIRPMFPKDPVNHSHEERHVDHMNDLAENEQVILMDDGQDLGQLYMAMRQVSSHVKQLHRGEDMSVHVHTHPSTGEKAVDKKFPMASESVEWSWCSEPGIQMARRENKHQGVREHQEVESLDGLLHVHQTSVRSDEDGKFQGFTSSHMFVPGFSDIDSKVDLVDGLLHITDTNVRNEDPMLGRGCSSAHMVIDPPPEVAEKIFEAHTGRLPTEEDRVKEIFSFDNKQQHSTSVERNDFSEPTQSEPSSTSDSGGYSE